MGWMRVFLYSSIAARCFVSVFGLSTFDCA
jgi:hypothetical protein